jgi:uncharacterized protein YabN with tetrapyrrole methylase and pyrophosphatase domain
LTRYLVEESYEALDALTALGAMIEAGEEDATVVAHAEEELGDLLFQVVFHAELGDEEARFNFATIADAVRDKLTGRHPHVFADAVAETADDVAQRWEAIKKEEKGRTSVLDGIAWQLPALTLYEKISRKAAKLGAILPSSDAEADLLADAVGALVAKAHGLDLDLEAVVRARALALADEIRAIEAD